MILDFNFKKEVRGIISVIGSSKINKEIERKTIEIGKLIAKNNYAITCGGLSGVMDII